MPMPLKLLAILLCQEYKHIIMAIVPTILSRHQSSPQHAYMEAELCLEAGIRDCVQDRAIDIDIPVLRRMMLDDLQTAILNLIGKLILMIPRNNGDVWTNLHKDTLQTLTM